MKISIALATYNGSRYLPEQLDSFLAQRRLPDEIAISDDCSTDTTVEVIEAFRKRCPMAVLVSVGKDNVGLLRNFERALSMCTGDLIFLSDQDDKWHKDKIDTVVGAALQHLDADVFVNDAWYADQWLNAGTATVLGRVNAVGAPDTGHIAGACTAVTRRFLRFILPFPRGDCPQHDVYVHRWANLLQNKVVIRTPLQLWRIHSSSATAQNEMHSPVTQNVLTRYFQTRSIDAASAYELKAREYAVMRAMLDERHDVLSALSAAPGVTALRANISAVIDANLARAGLARSGRLERLPLILRMLVRGQYREFKGLKSLVTDVLR